MANFEAGELLPALDRYVEMSFTGNGLVGGTVRHLRRTLYWLLELNPQASPELQLAALGHDLERAFRTSSDKKLSNGYVDEGFLHLHQSRSAELLEEFLLARGCNLESAVRVGNLVRRHELGGDVEQNLLKDVDSISFFENNIQGFLTTQLELSGSDQVREKIEWMWNRIDSPKAKAICADWHTDAIATIDAIMDRK